MKRIIGITGGVGSGKSTVLEILEKEYCAQICKSDELGHLALEQGTETYHKITEHFGKIIICKDGEIDRKTLAEIIFKNREEKSFIDSLIHPYVLNIISEKIINWKAKLSNNNPDLFIIETALMFETGCDRLCDSVIGVTCDENIRIKRLMETRGYTEEKTRAIIKSQISNEQLEKQCDMIINNSGTRNDLQINITNLMQSLSR